MSISFNTLNSTKTYTFNGPSSGGGSNIFTYTVEVTLNNSNSTQDYFSFDVTLKIRCNQSTFTWSNWSSQRVKLYMNAGSGASTSSAYLVHDAGLPNYSSGQPTVTIFTKENILISRPSGTTLYITISVENTTGTSITYLPGSVTNSNDISINITSGLDVMKLYPEGAIQNIADAIRTRNNYSSTYTVNQMAYAINNIERVTDLTSFSSFLKNSLYDYTNSKISVIGPYAFTLTSIQNVSLVNCNLIDVYAFSNCRSLSSVYLPECTYISNYAFYSCTVRTLYVPKLKTIDYMGLASCTYLSSLDLPCCTYISNEGLERCSSLYTISIPKVSTIHTSAFAFCSSLATIYLPSLTMISGYSPFCYCINLVSADLGSLFSKSITTTAFSGCYNLLSLYIRNPSVIVSLANINAFKSTPISNYTTSTGGVYGSIFVPASLVSSYKTATNWATYSNRITSI